MSKDSSSSNSMNTGDSNNDSIDAKEQLATEKEFEKIQKRYSILNYSIDSLFNTLKKTIIGQDECVKKLLFVQYNNHFLNLLEHITGTHIKHLNALAIGPSGSGKTLTISKISELFNVPYVKIDATSLTSAGYVGIDVDSIYLALIKAAGGDFEAAQQGIIFIDEIDKKVSSSPQNTSSRDINGTAVQEELLNLLQPSITYIGKELRPFNPRNITIYLGGHFRDLPKIREKRLRGTGTVGFESKPSSFEQDDDLVFNSDKTSPEYIPEDLINFGLIPEFVGRILIYTEFKKLSLFDTLDIIHAENSILQQYLQVFASRGTELFIDETNFFDIACEVLNSSTGTRDLEKKIIDLLYPALYQTLQNYESGICEINADRKFFSIFPERKK